MTPLEKGTAIHSSVLPGEFHRQGGLVGYNPWGHKSQTRLNELTNTHTHTHTHTPYDKAIQLPLSMYLLREMNLFDH